MRDVLRRFAVLGSTSLLTQLIAFATLAITARRVGPANLGAYNVILSIITFLSLPISFGITNLGIRDVAKRPDRVRDIAGEVFVLQLILAAASYVLLILVAPLIGPNDAGKRLIPVVALFLFTGTSFEWALQAMGRMRMIAVSRIGGQLVFGALVPFLVISGFEGVQRYAWLMVAGFAIKHVATSVFLVKTAGWPRLRVTRVRLWGRFRASWSMSFASVMAQAYGTMDLIMLGYLSTATDAGLYAAAYRIPTAILTFSAAWSGVVFPHSAALAAADRVRLRGQSGLMLAATVMFALPLAACTPFVAHGLYVVRVRRPVRRRRHHAVALHAWPRAGPRGRHAQQPRAGPRSRPPVRLRDDPYRRVQHRREHPGHLAWGRNGAAIVAVASRRC